MTLAELIEQYVSLGIFVLAATLALSSAAAWRRLHVTLTLPTLLVLALHVVTSRRVTGGPTASTPPGRGRPRTQR